MSFRVVVLSGASFRISNETNPGVPSLLVDWGLKECLGFLSANLLKPLRNSCGLTTTLLEEHILPIIFSLGKVAFRARSPLSPHYSFRPRGGRGTPVP